MKQIHTKLHCQPTSASYLLLMLILLSISKAFGASSNALNLQQQQQFDEEHHSINISTPINTTLVHLYQSQAAKEQQEQEAVSNTLDGDLLAVETTKLLSLGKFSHQLQTPQPPYATNNSNLNSSNIPLINQLPLNDTQIHRLPPLIRHHQHRHRHQDIRLLYPSAPSSFKRPSGNYQPVISGWHSLYFPRQSADVSPSNSEHQSQPLNQTAAKPISQVSLATPDDREVESSYKQVFADKSNQTSRFPSLIEANSSQEDEFEQSLVAGHYQRTNNAPNITWHQLLRQATESNVMESLMVTNKSMVSLLCDTNEMLIRLKFKQPFNGLIMTNSAIQTGCRLVGSGGLYYEMRVSLQDCGTRQEMPRLFINNIRIQFHPLESAQDELKTIICSYPIKPRTPPPPELPSRISERIVEAPSEPAKLVYYEPLVLISGLLLLSLTLLGLTSGAYLFSKRVRAFRERTNWSARSGLSDSYRTSPAQLANFMAVPPLIGIRSQPKKARGRGQTARADKERQTHAKQYPNQVSAPETKPSIPKRSPLISMKPGDGSDSLADFNDRSSITTIEIPFSNKNKQPDVYMDTNSVANIQPPTSSPKSREQVGSERNRDETTSNINDSLQKSSHTTRRSKSLRIDHLRYSMPDKHKLEDDKDSAPQSKEVQVGGNTPPFGSLRATLTSPNEFKRLQDITRLFDEVHTENRVDRGGDEGSVTVYQSQLKPSKYKDKIVSIMEEDERRLLSNLLYKDELFRSLVVEATDKDTFKRKLRGSVVYSSKFNPATWDLLEEILLDFDINAVDERELETRLKQREAELNLVEKQEDVSMQANLLEPEKADVQLPDINNKRLKLGHDNESVVVSVEAKQTNQLEQHNHDDSLESEKSNQSSPSPSPQPNPPANVKLKDVVRVSQFNSTTQEGGMTGTLININSVTNFSSSKNFSTYTRSSIEHRKYQQAQEDSLPYVDDDSEKVSSYEYAKGTLNLSDNRRLLKRSRLQKTIATNGIMTTKAKDMN